MHVVRFPELISRRIRATVATAVLLVMLMATLPHAVAASPAPTDSGAAKPTIVMEHGPSRTVQAGRG